MLTPPRRQEPVILAVDDEAPVLAAIARDLRREYGAEYRILRADSGASALDALRQLKLQNEPVALLVADQRMPHMTGVDFLARAVELFPDAKRVLLTAYADTEAAIRAINEVKLDHYLRKPWDPPEEHLFPVLTDLLDDWQAAFAPPFEGVRVIGNRWSAATHAAKEFLARNLVPYIALDVETDPETADLLRLAHADEHVLPVVLLPDGSALAQPTHTQLAEKIGLRIRADRPFYDLAIVGAGPSGLAAAVYGASEGLSTVLVEAEAPGGQAGTSSRIENYLGFPSGVSGSELTRRAVDQARRFGAEILTPIEATGLRAQEGSILLTLNSGSELAARSLIIATGVSYRKLDVPGVAACTGAGVYYGAASTEARACTGQDVYVLGAGNSAGQAAVHLAKFARQVTVLVRGANLGASMSHYLVTRLQETPNIVVRTRMTVEAVQGEDGRLRAVCLRNVETGETAEEPAFALFVLIGAEPHTDWVGEAVLRDKHGFILTGVDLLRDGHPPPGWSLKRDPLWLESSVPGIFVAGDVRHQSVKRVASAVGEGAMAVQFVHQHLAGM